MLGPRHSGSGERCPTPSLGPPHLPVPTGSPPAEGSAEGRDAGNQGGAGLPSMAHSSLVALGHVPDAGTSSPSTPLQAGATQRGDRGPPAIPGSSRGSVSFGRAFAMSNAGQGLDNDDLQFLSKHLAGGTVVGYGYIFRKFSDFCFQYGVDPFSAPPWAVVKYIRNMFDTGAKYSTINHHRSAISKFHVGLGGTPMKEHPLVKQAVRAVFRVFKVCGNV